MFIYKTKKFILNNGSECKLVLPDKKYAEDIYKVIVDERLRLAKYLPWAMDMKSVQDEEQFLEYSVEKIHKEEMMMFIILVDENVAGMIDLHNINKNAKPDFDSFRYKKTLMKGVAIAFHQGEIGIIFLYTFFYIRNISYKRNFIHLYRINYIKILF